MLNITPQANATGAKAYFAKSDYYAEGQEIVGQWGGKGAVLLGLFGKVDKQAFDRLCDNQHPLTGEPLTAKLRDGRRVGYDFTWSAPKSVSVVHALSGDDAIMAAFRDSVHETMAEMEAEMQTRVRKRGQDADRTTGNWCYAEFVHLTSRPVNGMPCPQLHAHLFVQNATFDSHEEQWKAGQFGTIKQDAYYWQAVQQARFSLELRELGYSVRKTKDAFEITGVPDSTLKKFSLRTGVIDRMAERLGITSPKAKAKLAATTREAKDDTIPYSDLIELWKGQLTDDEASALAAVAKGKSPAVVPLVNDLHAQFAAEHLFERSSVVDERRLLALGLRHGCGEVTPEGVRAEVDRQTLKRAEHGKVWVTTREVLAEESAIISTAVTGKGACKPAADRKAIVFRDERLNAGQRQAVEHVLTSADRIMVLRGSAGTGKTTLTTEAVWQFEQHGKPVVMLAPSAEASRGVLRREGFAEADTLTRFLGDREMQMKAKGGIIWVDEASLVSTRTMRVLFETAVKLDARVVLAGDKRQLASVERGAALRILEEIAGLPVAEATEIQRQKGDYRDAVKLLASERMVEGFDKLDSMGCVKLLPTPNDYTPIGRDYVAKLKDAPGDRRDQAVLIVCPTHSEGAKVTAAVRSELKQAGLIGNDERQFTRLVPLSWTEAERADMQRYSGEEVLQFHHNIGAFKAGQRVRAADAVDRLPAGAAKHFSVFGEAGIDLSPGDAIRITANGKTADGRHSFNNGATYRVSGFTREGDLALKNGWVISKSFGHWSHGYVTTAHAAQGRTVTHVLVAQTGESAPASYRENFYVAASRGKQSVTVYTDDKQSLKEAIQRHSPRVSATELVAGNKRPFWKRVRESASRIQRSAMVAVKRAAHDVCHAMPPQEVIYER
jgi:conjugative relaxase-like TrwC/TraI family protein